MTATVDLRGEDREAWLAWRRMGVGSSDVAAICGLDPYCSALEVYLDKIGQVPDEETSEAIEWGNRLEAVVADHFAETTGWDVQVPTEPAVHPVHIFMRANVDRYLSEPGTDDVSALLEIKTTGAHLEKNWGDEPPDRVLLQVQHQLAVTGLPRAFVAVLIGGQRYRQFEVARDDELIASLVEIEREFWERVESRTPPPADASVSASEALARLYADFERESEIDLPPEASALLSSLRRCKAEIAVLKDEDRRLSNAVKELLGHHHIGLLAGEKAVTWSRWTQKRLDRDALETDHPDLVARYLVDDPRDRLNLAKKATA